MPQLDRGAAEHGAVRAILEAHDRGYKTILTLKFPYHRGDFPKAGTPAFERELARVDAVLPLVVGRSEEHPSELQSLMRISYAVFCLKKKTQKVNVRHTETQSNRIRCIHSSCSI